jgi:hypothetical protein
MSLLPSNQRSKRASRALIISFNRPFRTQSNSRRILLSAKESKTVSFDMKIGLNKKDMGISSSFGWKF